MSPTMTAKEQIIQIASDLPDDSSYDEIVRELAFNRMVERGFKDMQEGRTISSEEMRKRIRSWGK